MKKRSWLQMSYTMPYWDSDPSWFDSGSGEAGGEGSEEEDYQPPPIPLSIPGRLPPPPPVPHRATPPNNNKNTGESEPHEPRYPAPRTGLSLHSGSGTGRSLHSGSGTERSLHSGSGTGRSLHSGSGTERSLHSGSGTERSLQGGSGTERSLHSSSGVPAAFSGGDTTEGRLPLHPLTLALTSHETYPYPLPRHNGPSLHLNDSGAPTRAPYQLK